jgi:hypothetical protein
MIEPRRAISNAMAPPMAVAADGGPRSAPWNRTQRAATITAMDADAGWPLFAVVQAGVLTFTAAWVYYMIFSKFTYYDDEGFMMMTVRHVLDGHRPYDEVITAYGPVYYLYKWFLHAVVGLPLSHDVVRLNALVIWIGTALLSSCIVFAMTRALTLAVITQVLVVELLEAISVEPGHPQEMGVLAVAAVVLTSVAAGRAARPWGIVALGTLVGALAMIKVNLGVFAGAAVWMALISTLRTDRTTTALRALSAAAIVALPVVLTWQQLDSWMRFTAIEVSGIASVLLLARATPREDHGVRSLATFSAACGVGIALGALFPLLRHSSLSALVECLIVLPRRLGDLVFTPPSVAAWSLVVAGVGIALSALSVGASAQRAREADTAAAVAAAKLAFGLFAALAAWQPWPFNEFLPFRREFLFSCLTPFLWLLLLPGGHGGGSRVGPFPRLVLVWMALLQPLQAYPVPGSQLRLSIFLHVVCAMVALGDVRDWAVRIWPAVARPAPRRVAAAVTIAAVLVLVQLRLEPIRRWHEELSPLDLPGAQLVRLPANPADDLRSLVEILRTHADTFMTYPGFNSLYFWTGKNPPTLDVLSHDVRIYSEQRRQAMMEALLAHEHPYVVRYRGLVPADPSFTRLINSHFKPITRLGSYQLMVLRNEGK